MFFNASTILEKPFLILSPYLRTLFKTLSQNPHFKNKSLFNDLSFNPFSLFCFPLFSTHPRNMFLHLFSYSLTLFQNHFSKSPFQKYFYFLTTPLLIPFHYFVFHYFHLSNDLFLKFPSSCGPVQTNIEKPSLIKSIKNKSLINSFPYLSSKNILERTFQYKNSISNNLQTLSKAFSYISHLHLITFS